MKSSKFSQAEVTLISEMYEENCPISEISAVLGIKPRSIITKLALLGLYRKPPKLSKLGIPATSKEDILAEISSITSLEFVGLKKAHKSDLLKILGYIRTTRLALD